MSWNRFENKQVSKLQRSNVTNGINDLYNNPVDEYNINSGYLLEYGVLMDSWRTLKMYGINGSRNTPDYYNNLIMLCETMLDLLSAKISETEEDKYNDMIEYLHDETKEVFFINQNNEQMMDVTKAEQLKKDISKTFRFLLRQMQERGLLTRVSENPNTAINDIGE